MLTIRMENAEGTLRLWLRGQITENGDLARLVGQPAEKRVEVHCREITRINSIGVRNWIRFFRKLREDGAKLRFIECPSCLMEQGRLVNGFLLREEIESVCLTYVCEKCDHSIAHAVPAKDLAGQIAGPPVNCAKCGETMQVDELVDEIFSFVNG